MATENNLASIAVKIDQETITKTVERIVLQEIAAKLGEPGAYFERVIRSCVGTKVDRDGKPTNSDYSAVGTLIDYLAQNAVKEFAKKIIDDWMEDNRVKLRKAIETSLQKNVGTMAKILADGAAQRTTWSNQITLNIVPPKNI